MNLKLYGEQFKGGQWRPVTKLYDNTADVCEYIELKYNFTQKQAQELWDKLHIRIVKGKKDLEFRICYVESTLKIKGA